MDLPATQAIDEDEILPTQQITTNKNNDNEVIGTLSIGDKQHLILSGITTIGRHPTCTIIINHETVSKKHAEIEAESIDGSLFIKDLNSCNKTKINNTKLRSYSSYQIKDGDKLIFGQVTSTFKLHYTSDDSFIVSTPQIKKKIQPFIPGTPDSSLNASSTSENNVSVIPETQTDIIETSFQRPEISILNNEQISVNLPPVMNSNFLSSSLSSNKSDQNDITSCNTQILPLKEEFDNSINASEIHYSISGNKSTNDLDENIYDMETQRPSNLDENEDNIENAATQHINYNKSDLYNNKFNDLTIYDAKTQDIDCETSVNDSIINLEKQQLYRKSEVSEKTVDNSIYSAATQKILPEMSRKESAEDFEIQLLNCDAFNSNKSKLQDMSIYSTETQKIESKVLCSDIEYFETQKLSDPIKENLNNKYEESIYTAETQIIEPRELTSQQYINNMKIEKHHNVEYNEVSTLNLSKIKSNYKSLDETSHTTMYKCLDIETHLLSNHKSDLDREKSDNKLFYDDSLHKNTSAICINESIENSDKINNLSYNYKFEKNKEVEQEDEIKQNIEIDYLKNTNSTDVNSSMCHNQKSIKNIESENSIKKNLKTTSNLEYSMEDMEKIHLIKDKNSAYNDNEDCDTQDFEELSFDSGFRTTEQESDDPNKTNNIKCNDNKISELQDSKKSMSINNYDEADDLQKKYNCHSTNESFSSTNKQFKKLKNIHNEDQIKNVVDSNDEDEMFCSQNLIQDCSFAFLSEESQIDDQSNSNHKNPPKIEKYENESTTDKIFKTSINIDNKILNNDEETLQKKNKKNDTETNEGIFPKENDIKNFNNKNNINNSKNLNHKEIKSDSETDEEGIFHKENESKNFNNKNNINNSKKVNHKEIKSDSETDEEGIFHKENESKNFNNKNNINNSKKVNHKEIRSDSETDEEGIFHIENGIQNFNNKNNINNIKKVNHKEIKSDSETDEEGTYSSHLSTHINKNSSFNHNQYDSDINKDKIIEKYSDNKNENYLISLEKQPISFKENNIILESSTTDSESSIFNDYDDENKCLNQVVQSSCFPSNLKRSQKEKKLFTTSSINIMSTSAEVVNVCKSSDIPKNIESNDTTSIHLINVDKSLIDNDNTKQCLPVQIINGQKLTIANDSDNVLLPSTSKMPRQPNLSIKEVKEFKDIDFILSKKIIDSPRITELSSKIIDKPFINKNIEVSKNDLYETGADQMIGEIKPKISLNCSKRQLEELDIKFNKSNKMNNYSNSKVNTNDSIERNLDEMFEGYQEKSIEKEPVLLTQQLTDILESSELENSSNIDFNSSTLSPTLGTRKSNVKIKNRRRTMLFEKSCTMLQTNKSKDNLNDTIEQNLNEIFKNTDNTVRTYESDGMLTQQLKSVLQSQNNSQLFNDDNITEKKPLSLSTNSGKKHRLSLSINLNNSFGSEIEKEKSTKLNKMLTLDSNKQEATLQKSNIDNDSQDTEIYFANIKSNKKKTFIITSQSEDELGDFQSLDGNDKEIVKKQENERLSSENIKESDMLVKCNQSNDNFLNKIETDTSKGRPKKRISLSLSNKVNLNSSQGSLSDLEVEQKFSRKEDYKSTMSRINTSNESETIPTDVLNNPKSRRTSFDKVCTPNNTNLFINEIANTDDCVSSDDDFLRSMPEIKVAGTADCPATSSQLAAPSDDDYDDEETTIVPISPTDIVIPTKWNWYAKKRYDLIYQKNRSDIKNENNNEIQTGSQSKKTQISGINNILTRIESASKRHNSKNSRHLIVTKEENIRRSTRSRHVHEANSIETFPTIINDNSDSNSDIESSSILERIIPKYKTLEPVKLDLVRYATDDSDEEFELLRKRCERMLAAPRVYKNLLTPDKNLKQTKVKNKNTKTRYTKKGNRGSLKISCSYTDDDEDDDDDIHSRRNISKKTRIADEDALVFQISTGDSKEYSKFRMSKLGTIPNKKETKAGIDDSNRPELLKNSGIKNNRQHLKLQEVSVLISPLKENVLSRFNTDYSTNIHDNIKSNFKQPIDINTTTTRVKGLLKSNIKLNNTPRMKRSRNNIENKAEPTRTRNQAMLNIKRAKLDIQLERSNNSSKENLYVDDSSINDTSCPSSVRTTRLQKNKAMNLLIPVESENNIESHNLRTMRGRITRQNKNNSEPMQKSNNIKKKDIITKLNSERHEENIAKKTKNKRRKFIECSDLENPVITNRYITRSTRVKDDSVPCLNSIETKKPLRIKNASINEISHLKSNKLENITHTRTRSRRTKDNNNLDTKQSCINFNNETQNQVVEPSEESQEVMNILKNIKDNVSESNEINKKRLSNSFENNQFDSNCVSKKSASRIKRPTLHRLAKNKSITQFNELSNEVTMPTPSTSRKRNRPATSELPISSSLTSSKSRRSISSPLMQTPYKILFTGDKSKTYTETVTKLGGYITEDPAKCSILVTDKIRRTFKFLCSVARGIPIVSLKWLDDSNKSHYFLEWKNYILKDVATETRLKFKLMESLKKAENHKLFVGYTIILTPNITQPPISELKEMITFSGGKCLLRMPRNWQEKTVVITQADDIEHAKKIIKKAPISVTIHSKEFLLTGILKQEINLIEYKVSI